MSLYGFFITFEGGEGAGKSTQIHLLEANLRRKGHEVLVTREPGGSPGAEAVRCMLLSGAVEALGPKVEAVLFAAARLDHVEQVIRPALARGAVVLCDRFFDSTRAYQGTVGELTENFLRTLERIALVETFPDLTLIFDVDPRIGLHRAEQRRGAEEADRFEKDPISLHQQRRDTFLAIATREPERCVVIDANRDVDAVAHAVTHTVDAAMGKGRARDQGSAAGRELCNRGLDNV